MAKFETFTSRVIPLPINNIDTDQIIPARFLKVTDKNGLGNNLFTDWRYLPDGSPNPDFILNQPAYKGAQILIAGDNFGCGSSREHAPWALLGYGIKAILSSSFADIFRNNSLKNGLLPVEIDANNHAMLFDLLEEIPNAEVTINLQSQIVSLPTGNQVHFPIDAFSKNCLLNGIDELGYILSFSEKIVQFENEYSLY